MHAGVHIGLTETTADLEGILRLQHENLKMGLTHAEACREGFTTAVYTLDYLRDMHRLHPSVVARSGDRVVGYALVTLPDLRHGHPLLEDLFRQLDRVRFRGRNLSEAGYVVVGQLCVAKAYRGKGLVQAMYGRFSACLSDRFAFCACDVDRENPRSLRAHLRTGFEVVDTLAYGGALWDMLVWDWRLPPSTAAGGEG